MTYESGSVKRSRRTRAEIEGLDNSIIVILQNEAPLTLRQLYYRLVAAGSIDKTEAAYGTVKRRLLDLRETGRVSWRVVVDSTRFVHAVEASDPRSKRFTGQGSVEIEAIPRAVILATLRDRIEGSIDRRALEVVRVAEKSERALLLHIASSAGGHG